MIKERILHECNASVYMGEDSRTDGTVVTDTVGLLARPLYRPIYKTLPHTTPPHPSIAGLGLWLWYVSIKKKIVIGILQTPFHMQYLQQNSPKNQRNCQLLSRSFCTFWGLLLARLL